MSGTAGQQAFELAFQCSPIVFVNGIATNMPFGMLPIISITQTISFVAGLLGGAITPGLDDFFAAFEPLPGATIADYELGKYPFANQKIAANAIIAQPLTVSMLMRCPSRPVSGGFAGNLAIMMALQAAVAQHAALGGTYIVITPMSFWRYAILKAIRDVTSGASKQRQSAWQWDFEQPLLTLEQSQGGLLNNLMSSIANGTQLNGDPPFWSGLSSGLGSPNSAQAPNLIPSAGAASVNSPYTIGNM